MSDGLNASKVVIRLFLVIIALGILLVFGPLATIWALNTLFGTGIEYTFWTWLAMFVLVFTISSSVRSGQVGK